MRTEPLRRGTRHGFRISGSRSGAAYVLAITTLLVGVMLGLAMIRSAGSAFFAEDTRQKRQAAVNLAEAGADYAFWQVHYNGAHVPYSATVSLGDGQFSVTATDDGARERSILRITSTGAVGGHSHTVQRATLGLLPYHYAYCENQNADDGDTIASWGTGRGFRANGRIKFDSPWTNVSTGAWATTTVSTGGTIAPQYTSSPQVLFPDVDSAYYSSAADYTYLLGATISSPWVPGRTVIVYVLGDLRIRGTYNGVITVYCSHDIIVDGNLTPENSSSYLALIAGHKIRIEGSAPSCEGLFYSHTASNNGLIEVRGTTTVIGSVAADDINTDQTTTFRPSTRWDLDAMRKLRLPGLQ